MEGNSVVTRMCSFYAVLRSVCGCLQVLPKVKQQLEVAHRDVVAVAADLQRGVQRNMREMQVRGATES